MKLSGIKGKSIAAMLIVLLSCLALMRDSPYLLNLSESLQHNTVEEVIKPESLQQDMVTDVINLGGTASKSGEVLYRRLIHDTTLRWNQSVPRKWLEYDSNKNKSGDHPPYMILITNVGWNHPNQTYGKTFLRFTRERQIFNAIINHPYFHPTAWELIANGTMPIIKDVNYYVFPDVLNCPERNYPYYGKAQMLNMDTKYNRPYEYDPPRAVVHLMDRCGQANRYGLLKHPLFQQQMSNTAGTTKSILVVFNCQGNGPSCGKSNKRLPISYVAIGGLYGNFKENQYYMDEDKDQGMMPPPNNPSVLTEEEEEAIRSCKTESFENRPLLFNFVGAFRASRNEKFVQKHFNGTSYVAYGTRAAYRGFHDPSKGYFAMARNIPRDIKVVNSIPSKPNVTLSNITFHSLMKNSKFSLVPRGDNKFSYRLTEVLSAGAIPVLNADDFMLPYRPEVVDWNKCAIIVPERNAGKPTIDIMQVLAAHPESLCQMRKYCYFEIYKKYALTPSHELKGWIAGFEALARGERKPPASYICTKEEVENLECDPRRR